MKAYVTAVEFETAGFGDGRLKVVVERGGPPGRHADPRDFPPDVVAALAEWLKPVSS